MKTPLQPSPPPAPTCVLAVVSPATADWRGYQGGCTSWDLNGFHSSLLVFRDGFGVEQSQAFSDQAVVSLAKHFFRNVKISDLFVSSQLSLLRHSL